MPDKTLKCKDCNMDFIFSESEQAFYKEKGFENEPQRCPACRQARKQQGRGNNRGGGYARTEREMYPAICAECGKETMVPFKPTGDRPIYCRDCFQSRGR